MTDEKPGVAYFLSHPIQYFSPLLKEMARHFNLHVYYFSDASIKGGLDKGFGQSVKWDIPLLEGYESSFIKNYSRNQSLSNNFLNAVNPGVVRCLRKDPSGLVIVNGWSYLSTLLTIITAKILRKKVWLRAETPLSQELKKGNHLLLVKKVLLKHLLFRLVDKFLYIGKESRKFFEFYGAKEKQLVYTPYAVDNAFFSSRYNELKADIQLNRKSLNLPADKVIILVSGKYIVQKRPLDILQAFKNLNREDALLVMVGEGELRGEMEKYIAEHALRNVILTGFINQSMISNYYAAADIFVMCSGTGETWGLSVNEAMNFALPVVVSATCGCSSDLVQHGQNGFVFPEGDTSELANRLEQLLDDEVFRANAGKMSQEIVQRYSIPEIVMNMKIASQRP